MIIVDAGVAVKSFVPEPGTPDAEALLTLETPRAAPEHVVAEVGQALLRHHRAQRLTLDRCRAALVRSRKPVRLFSTETLADQAIEFASEAGCSMYDALYLAAAERWNGVVVTADARLIEQTLGTRWMRHIRLLGDI